MRRKFYLSDEEIISLYHHGLIPKSTYHKAIKRGWLTLGWQSRGGILDEDYKNQIRDILHNNDEVIEWLDENKVDIKISDTDLNDVYSMKEGICYKALSRISLVDGQEDKLEELSSEAFIWALETNPISKLDLIQTMQSKVCVLFGQMYNQSQYSFNDAFDGI